MNELLKAVDACQDILANYVSPINTMSAEEAINKLLGILDDQNLVRVVNSLKTTFEVGDKFTTPETGNKVFTVSRYNKHDVEAPDSRSRAGFTIFSKSYIKKVL
jgi:hypothetical protein